MAETVKPEVIKKTQESLGKYIKKPPLTEKLLRKPPFRFLHDIVTAVIRETGFLDGVFTSEELNAENIKDKDGKVAFLQKVIDAVKAVTGVPLTVRPTKIVAGHEPTKTNELLQAIGKALDSKLSSAEYVEQVNDKPKKEKPTSKASKERTKPPGSTKQTLPDRNKVEERSKSRDAERKRTDVQKKLPVDTKIQKEKSSRAKSNSSKEELTSRKSEHEPKEQPEAEAISEPQPQPEPTLEKELSTSELTFVKKDEQIPNAKGTESPILKEGEGKRPSSARPGHRKASASITNRVLTAQGKTSENINDLEKDSKDEAENLKPPLATAEAKDENILLAAQPQMLGRDKSDYKGTDGTSPIPKTALPQASVRPQTALRPRSARPPSARPAAPRIKDRGEVVLQEEASVTTGKVNVITENETFKEQDEDENFMVVEQQTAIITDVQSPEPKLPEEAKSVDDMQHGHLVAQILETKKELEDDSQQVHSKKVEIEWENGRRREREVAVREVERLQTSIQTLTRAANPLGKLMDFLQEDVDSMQRELESWRSVNSQLAVELKMEQSLTEESVKPLKAHLQQLEHAVEEQLNQLSALKASVLRNDGRINRLLAGHDGKHIK